MEQSLSLNDVAEILSKLDRVLIVTHENPDGDAFGSALGLAEIMRSNNKEALVLLPDELPVKYQAIAGSNFIREITPVDFEDIDYVISLDAANIRRIALGSNLVFEELERDVLNIDHHADNSVVAKWSYVDSGHAATAQLVYEIVTRISNWWISPRAATLLMLGIVTDTGSFRFTNTTSETFRVAGSLLKAGANLEEISNAAFFSKPRNQQLFEADVLKNCVKTDCNGRFLYAAIEDDYFKRHNFDMRDGESVIDLLREVAGVTIVCLIYRRGDGCKVSFRSKDSRYPVAPIAHRLKGGGHAMAAATSLATSDVKEAAKIVLKEVEFAFEVGNGEAE